MSNSSPTIPIQNATAALLTPRGRGAVATVRLIGDCGLIDERSPLFLAANGRPFHRQPIDQIVFGQWGTEVGEDVVLCRTAENVTEIHCHGGEAAVAAILADLESRGCRIVIWQQQLAETTGTFDTECLTVLTQAVTTRTADLLLEQQSGVLRQRIEQIREQVRNGETNSAVESLDTLLQWADFGLHLSQPWQVVIVGRPNVGKSSLINALVGFSRSIVYDRPGTTRDVVTAETAFDGWPVRLSDTAGLRDDGDAIEMAGMQLARESLATADCRILLFDTSRELHADDRRLSSQWPDAIRVAHKCDLPCVWGEGELESAISISSLTGAGVEALTELIVERIVPSVPPAGMAIPITRRQVDLLEEARSKLRAGDAVAAMQRIADVCDALHRS